jgi:hypothetical protein
LNRKVKIAGKSLAFLVLIIHFIPLHGQSYLDIVSIQYQLSPGNSFEKQSGKADVANFSSGIRLPVPLQNGDALLFGIGVNQLQIVAHRGENYISNYYYGNLPLGYQKKWSDSLSTLLMLIPRLSSDLEELSGEDAQLGALFLVDQVKSEHFKWKYGLYVNTEFFGLFFVPLIGFDWKVNERLRFFGTLPANMTGEFKWTSFLRAGMKFSAPTVSYRLSEAQDSPYLHQYTNQLSIYQDWYLTSSLVLQTQLGHTAFRYYRYYDNNDRYNASISGIGIGGGKREPLNRSFFGELNDGFVFQLGLVFRYDLEAKNK